MFTRIFTAAAVPLVSLLIAAIQFSASAHAADRRPDPSDPSVVVPATDYQSAFVAYRRAVFDEKTDWRRANDTVRATGGHAGAMVDAPKDPPTVPAMGHGGRAGHGGHGGHRQ